MAERKSSTATGSSTKAKTTGTPARKKTTTTTKVTTENFPAPGSGKSAESGSQRPSRLNLDPEHVGRMLHQRTTWIDEILAILSIVFGLVTILSLLSTAS